MIDAQVTTPARAVIIPLSMLIYSNLGITKAKETLRAERVALQMEIKAGFEKMSAQIGECGRT